MECCEREEKKHEISIETRDKRTAINTVVTVARNWQTVGIVTRLKINLARTH